MGKVRAITLIGVLIAATSSWAVTLTATQTLTVNVSALSKISVPATLSMTSTGSNFNPFAATLNMSYRARTTVSSGSATVTASAATEFAPAGGPSIAAGDLTYTCGTAPLGAPCIGTQTVAISSQTPVLNIPASSCTGGGGACSASDPNTVSVNLVLSNGPNQSTGTYQVTLQFTTSAI